MELKRIYDQNTGASIDYGTIKERDDQLHAYQYLQNPDAGDEAWLEIWRPLTSLETPEDPAYWRSLHTDETGDTE
jgi:hypothetical protein